MKILTVLAAGVLAVSAGCSSSPDQETFGSEQQTLTSGSFVQVSYACPQAQQATTTVKLKSAIKSGDTLVVLAGWNDATSTVTVTDSLGNVFLPASDIARNPTAPNSQTVYYAPVRVAGTDTVTVKLSAAAWYPDVRVAEYSGLLAPVASADSASTASTASAGPLSLLAGDLLVGSGTTMGEFVAAGSGFTKRVITNPDQNLLEDRVLTSSGSVPTTASDDGSPYVWQAVALRAGVADSGAGGPADASVDAAVDATVDAGDSAAEAATEAGADATYEASLDATGDGPDAGSDATLDAAADAGDAVADVTTEAANDASPYPSPDATAGGPDAAGVADAGSDAALDASPDASDATAEAATEAGSDAAADASEPAVPTLLQHVGSSTEELTRGILGNDVTITLPNAVGRGNALVLGVAYTSGTSWASTPVTDSNGNAWPTTPTALQKDSLANMDLAAFVLPNANPGNTTVVFHFAAPIPQFQFSLSEFAGIATTAPVSGTTGASGVLAPNLTAGTFTPGNNDANGGNLIWSYFYDDSNFGSGNEVTSFTPGPGFSLLDADIAWHREVNLHHAAEYGVQALAAPITPSITAAMSPSADSFVGLSIALRVASAGTLPPPGIRIQSVLHSTRETPPTSMTMQAPLSGNLIVLTTANAQGFGTVSSVTDNKGNTYTAYEPDGSEPQFFVAANAVTGNDLVLTINSPARQAGISWSVYGISGAATAPVDVVSGMPAANCSNVSSVGGAPVISPTGPGLTIAVMGQGQGPGLGVTSPIAAVFDNATYAGETDFDTMENADCRGHVYNAGAETESFTWSISAQPNNSCYATAAHFLQAP